MSVPPKRSSGEIAFGIALVSLIGAGSGLGASWTSFPDVELIAERAERSAITECKVHTDREIIKMASSLENVQLRSVNVAVEKSKHDLQDEIVRIETRLTRIETKLDEVLSSRRIKR